MAYRVELAKSAETQLEELYLWLVERAPSQRLFRPTRREGGERHASHWRASGIVSIRSGDRINITTGRDNAFTGQRNQRANTVSDDVYAKARTLANYFNPAAFAQPESGTYGNLKRNALTGPHYWNVDLAISRQISVVAMQTLELRLEAFNLFNTFNWGDPGTEEASGGWIANFNAGQFGRITTQAGTPRIIQLGVKYAF